MRKGMLSLLMVLCCGMLMTSGCAKKEIVKGDETVTSTPTPVAKPKEQPAPPAKPAVKEQPVKEEPIKETPVASADEGSRQPAGAATQQETSLERIFFGFDSHILTSSARETLSKNAEWMSKNPGAKLQIEGHCDERGSDEYNLALGEKRATAAQKYMTTLGVAKDRLSTISYGREKPLDQGHDEAAWAKNRRAEFIILR